MTPEKETVTPREFCLNCGHKKSDHIFEEGSCRPGFLCECFKYAPFIKPNTITLPRDVVEGLLETIEELVSDPNRNTSHKIAMLAVRFLKVKAAFKEAGE